MTSEKSGFGWFTPALKQAARRKAARLTLAMGIALLPLFAVAAAHGQSFSVVYSFTGEPDGAGPFAPLIVDSAGNLYGETESGGSNNCGSIFELPVSGGETVLYSFTCGADGALPAGGLLRDGNGNLYGTALGGGKLTN